MPRAINFEDENGEDEAGAMREACRAVSKLEWDMEDLKFKLQRFEIMVAAAGVKKQYTKFQVLSNILPKVIEDEVKHLLIKQATDFPQNDAYKTLKSEILKIFGPKPESTVERALNRVLVDKPSSLARSLVRDLCKTNLNNCQCCPDIVATLWKRQLSSQVQAGIAHAEFNKENFDEIVQLADNIHATQAASAAVQALRVNAVQVPAQSLDETQPAIPYATAEVAAVSRGGRGNRGGRWPRNRGGRGGGRGGNQNQSGGQSNGGQPKHKGPKHPDLPSGEWKGCGMHYKWGRGAHFCSEPSSCPWKNIYAPKPAKQ